MINYYTLLKINKNATEDDIKKAYRKQALECHPDVNKDKDAEETFKKISEAYAVLSDRQKRYIYDHTGTTNRPYPRGRGRCMGGMRMGKCSSFANIYRRRTRYADKTMPPDFIAE